MVATPLIGDVLSNETRDFYRDAMAVLNRAGVAYLVGGAYALERYTGVARHTKDFDLFVRPGDAAPALDALGAAGYRTELTFPHWLGKAFRDGDFVDIIFSSGNGAAGVDDEWFAHAVEGEVFGLPAKLCPAEEVIWQKAYIQERERYDGADIVHLIRARAGEMDWPRLLRRFGRHWRVLLGHLVLFGFVYPGERRLVPAWVMNELLERLRGEVAAAPRDNRLCQGTLLSREQYLIDVSRWGYDDARAGPRGTMSGDDINTWTQAIEQQSRPS